jgi:orotate phosphoribosyltransferase
MATATNIAAHAAPSATADGRIRRRPLIRDSTLASRVALTPKLPPGNLRVVTPRERLVSLLAARSARRGSFTLASGRQSSVYIDARLTTMSPDGLATIGPLALSQLHDAGLRPDSVGGLTLGADPVSYAIAYASAQSGGMVRAFTVRKEPKTHGTGRLIEGPFASGDSVVVIEDVITTGGSAQRAIAAVRGAGGVVIGVLAVVDREEGGCEALASAGVPVLSLTTSSEILALLP